MAMPRNVLAVFVVAAMATICLLPPTVLAEAQPFPAEDLLAIGSPRDGALGVRAWIDPTPDQPLNVGTQVTICVQADRDAYLTGLLVTPKGEITVFFPNRGTPDSSIKQGKVYSLFAKSTDLGLKLGKLADKPKLAFYVSSRPPALGSFSRSEKTGMIAIEPNADAERNKLRHALESIATDEGFNRVVVSTPGEPGRYFEVWVKRRPQRLMGAPRPVLRKLPAPVESVPPEDTTGVQGLRPDKPE